MLSLGESIATNKYLLSSLSFACKPTIQSMTTKLFADTEITYLQQQQSTEDKMQNAKLFCALIF